MKNIVKTQILMSLILLAYSQDLNSSDVKYTEALELERRESRATIALTPLMKAVLDNNIPRVKLLIGQATARKMLGGSASDLRINAQDTSGNTALMWAVLNKNPKIVKLLLEAPDIDITIRDKDKLTALELAVNTAHDEIVEMLLAKCNKTPNACSDINKKDPRGYSPLMRAAQGGNTKIVQLLLERGANPLEQLKVTGKDLTPMDLAKAKGHKDVASYIKEAQKQFSSRSAQFIEALKDNKPQEAKRLLALGIGVNVENEFKETPLFVAIEKGQKDLVRMLIDAKVDVNFANYWGDTPLSVATNFNQKDIVQMLIQAGAHVNAPKGQEVDEPLVLAAQEGFADIVKLLIKFGADVNKKDKYGDRPLTAAIRNRQTDIVKILIDAHANVHKSGSEWLRPLDLAMQHGNQEIITLLKKAGAKEDIEYLP